MVRFEVEPADYRHWIVDVEPPLAWVRMRVDPHGSLLDGVELKLNSYDLGVDIELANIVQRLRFEQPAVRVVILTSAYDRVFCAGANIHVLGRMSHSAKVNFCKFTNETRTAIEDATASSGQVYVAACNGITAGGGYELALACAHIWLQDDGRSAVSLPEVPLLGVLPGTGGLTRLVDKRRVRRDRADVFCTTAEGIRGRRAMQWRLVDALIPRSTFVEDVRAKALELALQNANPQPLPGWRGVRLEALRSETTATVRRYEHVELQWDPDTRIGRLTVDAPDAQEVDRLRHVLTGDALPHAQVWALRAFRELDDALLHLRFNLPDIGVVLVQTRGEAQLLLEHDTLLAEHAEHPFARELILHTARVLRRMDNTTRSFFAIGEPGSAFAGCLLELALASDRFYLLEDEPPVRVGLGPLNHGALPAHGGWSRLMLHLHGEPELLAALGDRTQLLSATRAGELGLSTVNLDALDWDDELRIAIEERASLSPDALSGMEQNLRFVGPESLQAKIFARLSAWQNWIFMRPNATGHQGALTLYGQPQRPQFVWERV